MVGEHPFDGALVVKESSPPRSASAGCTSWPSPRSAASRSAGCSPGHYPWLVTIVCALDWFLVNLLNRVVDLTEDRENGIAGTDFVARHRRAILYGGFALLGFSLVVAVPFAPWLLAASPRLSPARLRLQLARCSDGRRSSSSTSGRTAPRRWASCSRVFGYPLAWARGQLWFGIGWATVAVTAVYFFLFELSYEVIYDLRDAPGDAHADVRTYPVVHGAAGADAHHRRLCVASLAVLAAGYAAHVVPWRIAILGVGPLLQLFLYKRFMKRGITSRDCINLTWLGAALLVAYHGWVLAGLPGRDEAVPRRMRVMIGLELVCAAIVALYAVARRDALPELALLAVAGFVGEDSVIRAYGFYSYSPRWHLFLDRVPLAIVLIWPIVIHSAWRWRAAWRRAPALAPLVGAAIVLADASLIEPIAVHAGLWTWTEPGLFAVPPIGIIGWAYFAGAAIACLEASSAPPPPSWSRRSRPMCCSSPAGGWRSSGCRARLPAWPFVVAAWLGLGALAAWRGACARGGDSVHFAQICYFVDPEPPSSSSYWSCMDVTCLRWPLRGRLRVAVPRAFARVIPARSRIKSCVAPFMGRPA